jgi:hypothetical protein
VLRTIWDIIINNEDPQEDVTGFEECIHIFIASHLTAEDHLLHSSIFLTSLKRFWFNLFIIACAKSMDMLNGSQQVLMNHH